jgi:hypothetical protein
MQVSWETLVAVASTKAIDVHPANRRRAARLRPGTRYPALHRGRPRRALHDEIRRHAGSLYGGRPRLAWRHQAERRSCQLRRDSSRWKSGL